VIWSLECMYMFQILMLVSRCTLSKGAMTTYHLTSVLVLSTSVESAAKARMASQCIGAAAAAVGKYFHMYHLGYYLVLY